MTTHDGRTFDRLPSWDERNMRFLVSDVLGALPLRGRGWQAGPLLDQGPDGACVGFGWAGEAGATPVRVPGVDNALGLSIYHQAQTLDEWPGENYSGTSVLAGAKVMLARGYIAEYRWAPTATDVALAIGWEGPAVAGLPWHGGMMDTDAKGYLHPTGGVVGGHCVYVRGYSLKYRRFTLRNSWGSWGKNGTGDAYLSEDDMAALLADDGECAVPMGRSL